MAYQPNNIFARILEGEIPCEKVYEDDYALAFRDINPKAPVHVLVIPKGEYTTLDEFAGAAPAELMAGFFRAFAEVVALLGIAESGYRTIVNTGRDGGQEVAHLHFHVLAGRPIGRMVGRE